MSTKARRNSRLKALAAICGLGASLTLVGPAAASVVVFDFVGTCSGCSGMGMGEIVLKDFTPGQKLTASQFVSFTYTSNMGQVLITGSQLTAFDALFDPKNLADSHVMIGEAGQTFESTGSGFWSVTSSLNGGGGGGGGGGSGGSRGANEPTLDPTPPPVPQVGFSESGAFDSVSSFEVASPGVPEPATWALMIGGFGGVGGILRARRRRAPRIEMA